MFKRIVVSAILCGFVAEPALAAACYKPHEARAATVRQLQTELMVAALKCQGHPDGLTAKYNNFVRKFNPDLSTNAKILRSHFSRTYGKDHARRFDTYITTLANEASIRSSQTANYCASMAPIFETVLGIGGPELEDFAARAVVSTAQSCETPVKTVSTGKASADVSKIAARSEKR